MRDKIAKMGQKICILRALKNTGLKKSKPLLVVAIVTSISLIHQRMIQLLKDNHGRSLMIF